MIRLYYFLSFISFFLLPIVAWHGYGFLISIIWFILIGSESLTRKMMVIMMGMVGGISLYTLTGVFFLTIIYWLIIWVLLQGDGIAKPS